MPAARRRSTAASRRQPLPAVLPSASRPKHAKGRHSLANSVACPARASHADGTGARTGRGAACARGAGPWATARDASRGSGRGPASAAGRAGRDPHCARGAGPWATACGASRGSGRGPASAAGRAAEIPIAPAARPLGNSLRCQPRLRPCRRHCHRCPRQRDLCRLSRRRRCLLRPRRRPWAAPAGASRGSGRPATTTGGRAGRDAPCARGADVPTIARAAGGWRAAGTDAGTPPAASAVGCALPRAWVRATTCGGGGAGCSAPHATATRCGCGGRVAAGREYPRRNEHQWV